MQDGASLAYGWQFKLQPRHEEKRNKELAIDHLQVISVLLVSSMKTGFPVQGRSSGNTCEMTECKVYRWFCGSASPGTLCRRSCQPYWMAALLDAGSLFSPHLLN